MAWMSTAIIPRGFQFTFIFAILFSISACTNSGNSSSSEQEQNKTAVQGETVVVSVSDVANDSVLSNGSSGIELIIEWAIISRPANSNAELSDPNASELTFVADQPGEYVIGLIIRSGTEELLNTTFTIVVEPSDSLEPTDPANPTDPTDPANPTDPTNPIDPTDPAVPQKPETHIPSTDSCSSCHDADTWAVVVVDHTQVVGECVDCHSNMPDITHPFSVSNDCAACHETTTWATTTVDHNAVVGTCVSCHDGQIASGKASNHIPTTNECDACHDAGAYWAPVSPSNVDHTQVIGECADCHDGPIYIGPPHPIDTTSNCAACHNITAWTPASVDHLEVIGTCSSCHDGVLATGKGDTHIQTTVECDNCHNTQQWLPASVVDHSPFVNNCVLCHDGVLASGKSDTHINATDECDACHDVFPAGWTPLASSQVDHTQVIGTCSSCHDGTIASGKSPTHVATMDECGVCHNTTSWLDVVEPQYLWVIDDSNDQVSILNLADGSTQFQFNAPGGNSSADSSYGLAWDGNYIWTFHDNDNTLYKVDVNGVVIYFNNFPDGYLNQLRGLEYVDGRLWGVSGQIIVSLNPVAGSFYYITSPVADPQALAFDGVRFWVVGNTTNHEIYTVEPGTGIPEYKFNSPDVCPSGLEYYRDRLYIIGCSGLTIVDPVTGETIRNIPTSTIGTGTGLTFVPATIGAGINATPVADAGINSSVMVGNPVTLDGSGSSDFNGDALTYLWEITSRPTGSIAELNDNTLVSPTFIPDVAGNYGISLVVNDGTIDSAADLVIVTAMAAASCQSNSQCGFGTYCEKPAGSCGSVGVCSEIPSSNCLQLYAPVCGCDGVTYTNSCEAAANAVSVAYDGQC